MGIKQSIMENLKVGLIIIVINSSNKLLIIIGILMEALMGINNSEMGISMLSQIITQIIGSNVKVNDQC